MALTRVIGLATATLVVLFGLPARAALSLTDSPKPGDFILFNGTNAAPIFIEKDDSPAAIRAAGDLVKDVERVTTVKPELTNDAPAKANNLVVIGTLGRSKTVDRLAAEGKLEADSIRGKWESYVLQVVPHPWPGVDTALVIAGSDRRGTIYGIYTLSQLIGVSPWYWWADVPPKRKQFVAIRDGILKQGPPAVKYRGIFLNDEDWGLRPWASKTFDPKTGNIGPKTYAKVFELLLRLRANLLWPAMHPGTRAFNSYPSDKVLANQYGIVMGSSHCEQMLRDNIAEWNPAVNGAYNFVTNPKGVLKYWEQRVRENGKYENIYTVGMRGISDSGMPGGGTPRQKAERLHVIIKDQRAMLARWVNPDVAKVPQIFCPYKEVLELYRLAPNIPKDITIVWPDDNYGYIREFSNARERQRSGGAGVYYHVSYWGRPYDYLWLCSTPPALIWEELSKAWDYDARRLWMINVGDLKPAELDITFAMQLAWNPHQWQPGDVNDFLKQMFTRNFGPQHASQMAAIMAEYYRLNFQRKPEHMGFDPHVPLLSKPVYSVMANGDEADRRLNAWRALAARAVALGKEVPAAQQDAYYELVAYPVRAAAAMNEKGLDLTKFYAYAKQGRADAAEYLRRAQRAYDAIQRETAVYNNQIAGGKWRYMMSDHPRNRAVFSRPKGTPPAVPDKAILGIALEDHERSVLADQTDTNGPHPLPQFNRLTRRSYFVDVFDGGNKALHWRATPSASWIRLSQKAGDNDARVWVSIDWPLVPKGKDVRGTIRFAGANREIPVAVSVFNPAKTNLAAGAEFVEDNRRVVMEAAHATAFVPGKEARWKVIRGLGYHGEAVSVFPRLVPVLTTPREILKDSPCLEYKMWIRHPGRWRFMVRALPTFSVQAGKPQRYAIAVDQEPPRIVSLPVSMSERNHRWQEDVLRNAALTTSLHDIAHAGVHTLKIWMVDPGIVIDTIMGNNGSELETGYTWPVETRKWARQH